MTIIGAKKAPPKERRSRAGSPTARAPWVMGIKVQVLPIGPRAYWRLARASRCARPTEPLKDTLSSSPACARYAARYQLSAVLRSVIASAHGLQTSTCSLLPPLGGDRQVVADRVVLRAMVKVGSFTSRAAFP